jgi:Icc protein
LFSGRWRGVLPRSRQDSRPTLSEREACPNLAHVPVSFKYVLSPRRDEPIDTIRFLNAQGGGRKPTSEVLAVQTAVAEWPGDTEALVLTADLQGRIDDRLMGEAVAERVAALCDGKALPDAGRVGVVLAGDLWSEPGCRERGGEGDVSGVWLAFARHFRWVAGVLGNHDELHEPLGPACKVLDGNAVNLDGLRIGGVGGVIGRSRKLNRKCQAEFTAAMGRALTKRPDLLVLHHGPSEPVIRYCLEEHAPAFTVFGHRHQSEALDVLNNGAQACNVEMRLLILVRG